MLPCGVWLLSLNTGHWIDDHLPKSPHNYKKTQTQSDIEQSGAPSKYYGGCDPPLWVIIAIWFFDRFCAPSDSSAATSVCNSANKFSRARQLWPHITRTSKSSGLKSGLNRLLLTQLQDSRASKRSIRPGPRCRRITLSPLSRLSIRTIYNQYLMRDILCHVFLPIFFASTRW